MTDDPTSPDAALWADLRPGVRARLAAAVAHLVATGTLARADICRLGEVSANQATTDIRVIAERLPGMMRYDGRAKRYVRIDPAAPVIAAAPAGPAHTEAEAATQPPLAEMLKAWADRHCLDGSRAAWIAEATGMRRRTVEGWLVGKPADAAALIRRYIVLYDRHAGG